MRILIYGFGPYRQFRDNITARMIRSIPKRPGVKTAIFPVRFRRRQFVEAFFRYKPEVVLGLGQSSRKKIAVEARAKNQRRARIGAKPRPIFVNRPLWLPTTLKMRAGPRIERSRDAGDYVCNYSMYVLLDEILRRRPAARFGFIHVPYDCDLNKANRLLERVVKQIGRDR